MAKRDERGTSDPGPPPDRAALHEAALRHVARFAATEIGLVRVLDRRIARWQRAAAADDSAVAGARQAAREVARALVTAGVVNDAVFAEARARRLLRAGRSRRAVAAHLAAKGVDAAAAGAALPAPEAEFDAALAFTRRRRIGPFGAGEGDPPRELAALARAGFPRDVAERVLRLDPEEAAERIEALKRG